MNLSGRHPNIRIVLLIGTLALLAALVSAALVRHREHEEESAAKTYSFRLLYAILHDDMHGPLPPREMYERRLEHLVRVIERESFGRISVTGRLDFIHARELGDERLAYAERTVYRWIQDLEAYYEQKGTPYDILIFCPSSDRYGPWCTDAPSLGYRYKEKHYLCMETFLDPTRETEDEPAAALAIHKIMHGFGYNHISHENRPSNILEWSTGLPKTRIFPLTPTEWGVWIIFDKHIMKVLGFLPRSDFERECPDSQGFTCLPDGPFSCANSYDIRCIDADRDGIVDGEDDYLFTPYGAGHAPDTDWDGIPDHLDLCQGWPVMLDANIRVEKERAIIDREKVRILIRPAPRIRVRGVNIYPAANIRGFIGFPRRDVRRVTGDRLSLDGPSLPAVTRLQIFYDSPEGSFYRPFYLYKEPQQIEYVHEKEWYYFSRFGCDVPLGVDFSNPATYDRDLDGLPDEERFDFARRITHDYDWDSDGAADVVDSLPTVHGTCSDRFVRGVPDTDGDGLCDPAYFRFSEGTPAILEGDLAVSVMEDPDEDACPYVFGTHADGCPAR